MSEPQLPPRPEPPRRAGDVIRAWLAWFGLTRLVLAACSVLVVAAGAAWLVRSTPPTEAGLPPTAASVPTATLPPPPPTASSAPATGPVVVHVAGAVVAPGVYELAPGARIVDAVRLAGGPTTEADTDGLNLAAPVADGARVYVPVAGEIDPAAVPTGVPSPTTDSGPAGPIDLNVATAPELETLPGVGPATAAAIIDDRERNGPFASVDDLDRVPGIGPAKLEALRDLVTA